MHTKLIGLDEDLVNEAVAKHGGEAVVGALQSRIYRKDKLNAHRTLATRPPAAPGGFKAVGKVGKAVSDPTDGLLSMPQLSALVHTAFGSSGSIVMGRAGDENIQRDGFRSCFDLHTS